MKQILRFLKPYKVRMALGISLKTVATFIELLIPWGMSYMFQNIVPTNNVGLIFAWGGVLFAIAGITVLCNVIANRNACLVSRHATERIRLQLFAKMNYLSEEAQSEITGESLISRATSDTYNVHRFLGMVQRMGVRQPMVLLGSLVITFFMDPKLTLVLLIMIPVMAVTIVLFMKYGQPLFKKVQEAQDTFVRIVREDVNGIRVIKALSKGDTEKKRFNDVNNEVVRKNQFANNVMGGMHPLVRILLNIGMILVVYVGAKLVLKGDSTAETVLAFMTYVQMILNALIFMSRFFLMYTEASVSANRISEVMSKENTLHTEPETESEETIQNRAKESAIEFKNVSFGYGKNSDSVKNISFSVKRGETLGVIGATGSGKSTLVSLLMRYYDVRQGNVYVDGRDVRTYEDADLKCKFGAVFQNDIIFCESIRDNIKFGRDISDETILKAADAAQGEFIREYGLDYKLAIRGANISGGQRQRIYIARALAGDPEFLVLDDSSSALDYATDARLRAAIHENYKNTTTVIVAQRVSAIMNADRILVMEDGELVAQGTHEELMKASEIYREIAESQMGMSTLPPKQSRAHYETETKGDQPTFKDTETYDDIVKRVDGAQKEFQKQNHYAECLKIVKNQLTKERKANKGIDKKHTFKRLFSYLLKQKALLVSAIIVTIVSNVLSLWVPKLSGYAIDSMGGNTTAANNDFIVAGLQKFFLQGAENDVLKQVLFYCLMMLIAIVVSMVLSYLLTVIMSFITRHILHQIRKDMFEHILKLKVNYFDTHAAGDIISKITYDVSTLNTSLSHDVVTLASSLITVIGAFIMMITISPAMMSVFLITIPMTILYTRWLSTKTRPLFRARSGKLGELNGLAEEMIGGQRTIKAYNRQIYTINRFQKMNEAAVNAYYNSDYMANLNGPTVNFFSNLSLVLCTILGAILLLVTNRGVAPSGIAITLGSVSSFILYSKRFSGPINESANIISELQSALAAAERVFRLLDEPEEQPLSDHEEVLTNPSGEVELRKVDFGYVPEKQIIHSLNLLAKPGKVTAIVGPTGAGKTTVINLLMRFYDIDAGEILIDGKETRELTRDSVRKAFAMVLQETWLFTGTVFENVAYGNENATLDDVIRVCKAARIHNYIMRLPKQYDTVLTDDGNNISKGQKQLITIARAMLLNAHMLILDEATSNVDTRTELQLQKAMLELMKDKTCFIIAHRLSTIRNADNILVVDKGDVVEQGTHDELMALNGRYHALYEAQWSKGESI